MLTGIFCPLPAWTRGWRYLNSSLSAGKEPQAQTINHRYDQHTVMTSRRFLLAGLLVLLVLVVGAAVLLRRDDDATAPDEAAEAPPTPTPTVVPTVSPLPPLELERVLVQWVAVPDVFDFDAAVELDQPFAGTYSEQNPSWSIYVVDKDDPPHELLKTGRWVRGLMWDKDGLKVVAETQREIPSTLGTVTALWRVMTRVNPRTGAASDDFDALPIAGCSPCEAGGALHSAGRGAVMGLSPEGDRLVVHVHYDQGIEDPSRPPFLLREVYLVDADGHSRRLEGLPAVGADEGLPDAVSVEFVPGRDVLLGRSGYVGGAHEDRYIIPLESGEAVVLRQSLGLAMRDAEPNSPGPGDPRAVFAYYDANGPQGPGNYLGVYNAETDEAWLIGPAPPAALLDSSKPPSIAFFWPSGSERVIAGLEPNSELIDPGTGARQPGGFVDLSPPYKPPEVASPSGRYTAYFDRREPTTRDPACEGLPYRLNLRDERTGQTRILLQCDTDVAGSLVWLSNAKLVARIYNCSQCGPTEFHLILIDIDSGKWTSLTDGFEPRANAVPSPDGKKVAILGDSLRVFDDSGRLLHDYGPPPDGIVYTNVAWSPDSRSFAYVLVPEDFVLGT